MTDSPQIQLRPREEPTALCGFCRDTFVEADEVEACEGCAAPYHLECWRDELAERCATLGCSNEKPARGRRRFAGLRARLRRRRRRRLLHGNLIRGQNKQSLAFALGGVVILATGVAWLFTNLEPLAIMLVLGIAAVVVYVATRKHDSEPE